LVKVGFWSGVLGVIVAAVGLVFIDRSITATFEGRRWTVPATVFAQPLELYPGAALNLADLTEELDRLGYRQSTKLNRSGVWKRTGERLGIHLRPFAFPDRKRDARVVELTFKRNRIATMIDADTLAPITLTRMDPPVIGSFFPSHGEDRVILNPRQVPALLSESLKAVEDRKFDHHAGFDIFGIARAMWVNLRTGTFSQGGSTLTQQLVKSYFLDNRRTLWRKIQELPMAVVLDYRFTKEDLLTAYVNEIFLGQDGGRAIHGFGLGAQFYFNKPLTELDTQEIATLIAIIRGPSYYNPFRHPERVLARRDLVLGIMHRDGLIDDSTHHQAINAGLGITRGVRRGGTYYPAFMDLVRRDLKLKFAEDTLATQGLRIFTTLKPKAQTAVVEAIDERLNAIETLRKIDPGTLETAVIMTDTQTGEVLALAGGRKSGTSGFNRALLAARPMGSLIKPVIYLTALEHGYHLASLIKDEPVKVKMATDEYWEPQNFNGETHGEVPMIRALGQSLNLATVNLGMDLGLNSVIDRMQTLTMRQPDNTYPSLLLGAEPASPLEVAEIYGTFASGGFHIRPKAVIAVYDAEGGQLSHHPFRMSQKIKPEHVIAMNRAMEITVRHGTGRSSRFAKLGVAGKTGTSNDNRDSWFAGFDNNHLTVIWVGHDDNHPSGLTGTTGALQVWDAIMTKLGVTPLIHPPSQLTEVEYLTGMEARASCAEVVSLPLPDNATLPVKSGCGINKTWSKRLKGWFSSD
jgi:penicillin-binding protein 1B